MVSLKSKFICSALLFSAVIVRFSISSASQFLATRSRSPVFHEFSVSWFRGAYLYLVMNCIIVSIVASSKLQQESYGENEQPSGWEIASKVDEHQVVSVYEGDDRLKLDEAKCEVSPVEERKEPAAPLMEKHEEEDDEVKSKLIEEDKTKEEQSSMKPDETLDSMWQAITDSHQTPPPTTHLRKSDTWETQMKRIDGASPQRTKMKKFETYGGEKQLRKRKMHARARKLKREESLSHEELNQRVEAFINKFNEDLRLQRKKSLNNLKKMMNVSRVGV